MSKQQYSDLGFQTPLQSNEYPQEFATAYDIDQEEKDLLEREGDVMGL